MNGWFSQTLVTAAGWALVHFVWEGLVIAGLLAAALRLLRSRPAHFRYLAGCAAMLLMAVAPLVTFRLVLNTGEPEAVPVAAVEVQPLAPAETFTPLTTRPLAAKPILAVAAKPAPRRLSWMERWEAMMPWLVLAWVAGVCGLSCRLLAGWLAVRRLRRGAEWLSGEWPEKARELARRLRVSRPVRLLESALVEVPTVIGWLRPVILLPASCLTGLTPGQLESILAHELAHIRRHDYLINLLQSAVETVWFYHPAVWWVSRKMREERENCCDDLAVAVCGDRAGYARALATLEELRPASAQFALGAGGAPLLRRIRRLAGKPERGAGRSSWPVAGVIALLLLAGAAAGLRNYRAQAAGRGSAGQPMKGINTKYELHIGTNVVQFDSDRIPTPMTNTSVGVSMAKGNEMWVVDGAGNIVKVTGVSVDATGKTNNILFLNSSSVEWERYLDVIEATLRSNNLAMPTTKGMKFEIMHLRDNAEGKIDTGAMGQGNAGPEAVLEMNLTGTMVILSGPHDVVVNEARHEVRMRADEMRIGTNVFWFDGTRVHWSQKNASGQVSTGQAERMILRNGGDGFPMTLTGSNVVYVDATGKTNTFTFTDASPVITKGDVDVVEAALKTNNSLTGWTTLTVLTNVNGRFVEVVQNGSGGQTMIIVPALTNAVVSTNLLRGGNSPVGASPRREGFLRMLDTIMIDSVNYNDVSLNEALGDLSRRRLADPQGRGISIYSDPRGTDIGSAKVRVALKHVRLADVLDALVKTSDRPIKYFVSNYGVIFSSPDMDESQALEIWTFKVDPDALRERLTSVNIPAPTGVGDSNLKNGGMELNGFHAGTMRDGTLQIQPVDPIQERVRQYFTTAWADVSSNNGKVVFFNEKRGELVVRATAQDLDVIERAIEELNAPGQTNAGNTNGGGGTNFVYRDPWGSPYAITLGGNSTGGAVAGVLTDAQYKTAVEALKQRDESQQSDIMQIVTSSQAGTNGGTVTGVLTDAQFKTVVGALEQRDNPPQSGISRVITNSAGTSGRGREIILTKLNRIRIESVDYNDVTLKDALDDLAGRTQARDPDGAGINFLLGRQGEDESKVGSVKVKVALKNVRLVDILDSFVKTADRPIKYYVSAYAVEFSLRDTNELPAMEIRTFHVDPRALEDALEKNLGVKLGQMTNGLRNEVFQDAIRNYFEKAGVDLSTNSGKVVVYNNQRSMLVIRATAADLDVIEAAFQVFNTPKLQVNIKAKFVEYDLGMVNTNSVTGPFNPLGIWPTGMFPPESAATNSATATGNTNTVKVATVTGILTEAHYRMILDLLEKRPGTEVLTSPEVTTESGRQAQMQSVDVQSIILAAPRGAATGTNFVTNGLTITNMSFGPRLDVIPYISGDEYHVQMAMIPSVNEFLGYDNPGDAIPKAAVPAGGTITAVLPHFRLRQVVTSVTVFDGQTVVIGGFAPWDQTKTRKEQVPLLGDIPLIGGLFRSVHQTTSKKGLLVFVTATIVNADGTRYHTDEERANLQTNAPPQEKGK